LTRQRDQLLDDNSRLRTLLATVQAQAPLSPSPPSSVDPQQTFKLTPEDEEQWGPDFMRVVAAKAAQIVAPLKAELEQKIEALGGRVRATGETLQMSARQQMIHTLDADQLIRGWREVNQQPEFLAWLDQRDELSGQTRNDLLQSAFNENDAARVAAFFRTFMGGSSRQPDPQPSPSPSPAAAPAGKVDLRSLAAPGRAHAPAPSKGGEEPTRSFTTTEISRFYLDVSQGRYNGRDPERQATEAAIFKAQAEGLVSPG
jgi:hypothetical protein